MARAVFARVRKRAWGVWVTRVVEAVSHRVQPQALNLVGLPNGVPPLVLEGAVPGSGRVVQKAVLQAGRRPADVPRPESAVGSEVA